MSTNMRWLVPILAFLLPVLPAVAEDLIKVEVRVIDINKTKMHKVGLDWERLMVGPPNAISPGGPMEILEQSSPPLEKIGTFTRGQVDAFVRLIETNNYGKLLAEPKLVTVGGSVATFQVGGELPVVTQDSQGRTSVEWKQYGVMLSIKPERKEQVIRTHVRVEASAIDAEHAVSLPNGTYMPAIKNRTAEADVEMESRATIMIAGLLQTTETTLMTGVPLLMDLPLLGWLFRSTKIEKGESELVVFVTPSFVTAQAGVGGR